MKSIANYSIYMPAIYRFLLKNSRAGCCTAVSALLMACSTPQPPSVKAVYDFGAAAQASTAAAITRSAAVALPEIEAGAGLDSPAILYRLQYADSQQLRPYAQARWSVPPAQLVRTRLRDALAAQGPLLSTEGIAAWTLRIELDEFSQIFGSPDSSQGLVRLRASLFKGEQLAAQTTVLTRSAAPSQDAAGGVRALTAATDEAALRIAAWVAAQIRP
jgi:cholesterol transport system auxiliary component